MANKILKKSYSVNVKPYPSDPSRQQLSLMPRLIFKHPEGAMESLLHLIWYTEFSTYDRWVFDHLIITSYNLEMLTEPELLAEIVSLGGSMQPQECERRLQSLGFQRE